MSIEALKSAARLEAKRARALAAQDLGATARANAHLSALLAPYQGAVLAGYWPIKDELDPRPAMVAHQGKVVLPVIEAAGLPLRFRHWQQGALLERGPFGAMVPSAGAFLRPDVVILPLLGFSRAGGRLGYGGGFYDRTLHVLRADGPLLAVGFAYSAQELPDLPLEPSDQPLDALVTEAGVLRRSMISEC